MSTSPGPREHAAVPRNPFSVQMRYELEMTCDAFEDALSERSFVGLAGAIDRLQAWRVKYGMTHEPFEGSALEHKTYIHERPEWATCQFGWAENDTMAPHQVRHECELIREADPDHDQHVCTCGLIEVCA